MKNRVHLKKNKELLTISLIGVLFFALRFPSFFEPYWYGDEGIYEVIGSALNQGRILYTQIWDNKPPLLYITYSLLGADQFWVRFASAIVGILTLLFFYRLSLYLFQNKKSSLISTLIFALFFGLPIIEGNIANAENFMLLPTIVSGLIIVQHFLNNSLLKKSSKWIFIAGFLLGISFLYKTVAVFDFASFFLFLFIASLPTKLTITALKNYLLEYWKVFALLLIGFIVPFFITIFYFLKHNALYTYLHAIFLSNVGYVGYKNLFIIPQGLLILKFILLGGFILGIILFRKKIHYSALFIALWIVFSLFNSFFSQRPYTHYLLVILPSISLIPGLLLSIHIKHKKYIALIFIILIIILSQYFNHWSIVKTILYYPNFISFLMGKKSVSDYQSFFDRRTPRDAEIALYLRRHTNDGDTIFLWGNNAQIYVLSNKLPVGRFTVAYHMLTNMQTLAETEQAFLKAKPKYVAIFPGIQPLPFSLYNYREKIVIRDVHLYERIN